MSENNDALIDRYVRIKFRGACCRHLEEECERILVILKQVISGSLEGMFLQVADGYRSWKQRLQVNEEEAGMILGWVLESAKKTVDSCDALMHHDPMARYTLKQMRDEAMMVLETKPLGDAAVLKWVYQDAWVNAHWKEYVYRLCHEGRCLEFLNRTRT